MPVSSRNLEPGQYQIGDLIFGKHTPIKVSKFEEQAYNVAAQDKPRGRSDEIDFGTDVLQSQPITFEMTILNNYMLDEVAPYVGGVAVPAGFNLSGRDHLLALSEAWRDDKTRKNHGAVTPLYCCSPDGITRVIFGRPGKFFATKLSEKAQGWKVTAEFRRSDVFSYTASEEGVEVLKGAAPTYIRRTQGNSPAWLRILGYGPLTHPIVTIGEQQVELDIELAAGQAFEVSSYPERRRSVDSSQNNLSGLLIGETQYLDRLTIPAGKDIPIRWTSDEVNTFVPALGNEEWYVNIDDLNYKNLPETFTVLAGKPVVRFDLFNPDFAEKFIGSAIIGTTSACIYNHAKFNTAEQYVESKVVEPFYGSSAIVFMSTPNMSNFAALEVVSGVGAIGNKLRIITGTSPTSTTVRDTWDNPSIWGWKETDRVGIGASPIPGNPTRTRYQGYLNGVAIPELVWDDTTGIVGTGSANRSQGFIFDLAGNWIFTVGTGFREIVAYDRATVPAPTGRILVLWRNGWSRIP